MARTILVTAGTSILDNLRQLGQPDLYNVAEGLKGRLPGLGRMADLLSPPIAPWAGAAIRPGSSGEKGAWWFVDRYARLSPKDNAQSHAAEIASLHLLKPTTEDEIVLLCSDTPEGLFCGLVVAHLIKQQGDPIRVRSQPAAYAQSQSQKVDWQWESINRTTRSPHVPQAGMGKVSLWQIPGLRPTDRLEFERRGAGNLTRTFIRLARAARAKGQPFVVNFTGGYKATIPLLTLVASWMGSPAVSLVALYQESNELIHVPVTDSQPDPNLRDDLLAYLNTPTLTLDGVPAGRRRFFENRQPGPGLKWSLLGEALDIYFTEQGKRAT